MYGQMCCLQQLICSVDLMAWCRADLGVNILRHFVLCDTGWYCLQLRTGMAYLLEVGVFNFLHNCGSAADVVA